MILFRAVYQRDKQERCITFPALDDSMALQFARQWTERAARYWKDVRLKAVYPFRKGLAARSEDLETRQRVLSFEK